MNNTRTKRFIVATALIVLGALLFALSACSVKGGIDSRKYQTNTHEITDAFQDISILGDTADIRFVPSEDEKSKVVCFEEEKLKHSVSVEEGVLSVRIMDTRKWYHYINFFNFQTPKITIYLPQNEYGALHLETDTGEVTLPKDFSFETIDVSVSTGDVNCFASAEKTIAIQASTGDVNCYGSATESITIKTSTGDIDVGRLSTGALDLSASTGKIAVTDVACEGDVKVKVSTGNSHLTNVTCENLTSTGSTGDISLQNVIAAEKFSIERSTGDVTFDGADAAEIFVETDTGNVKGSLLTEKIFIVDTDTGRKEIPESIAGGKCKITTDTGNIKISIK